MAKNTSAVVNSRNQIRDTDPADRVFHALVLILYILCFLIILYPLWFVVIASISNSDMVNRGESVFLPRDIRFYGFEQIFKDSRILIGYKTLADGRGQPNHQPLAIQNGAAVAHAAQLRGGLEQRTELDTLREEGEDI